MLAWYLQLTAGGTNTTLIEGCAPQALLAAGADANICDHAGKTPLQYAIEKVGI